MEQSTLTFKVKFNLIFQIYPHFELVCTGITPNFPKFGPDVQNAFGGGGGGVGGGGWGVGVGGGWGWGVGVVVGAWGGGGGGEGAIELDLQSQI